MNINIEEFCEWISQGKPLLAYCARFKEINTRAIYRALKKDSNFASLYQDARRVAVDIKADEMIKISDAPAVYDDKGRVDIGDVQLRKIKIYAREKWIANVINGYVSREIAPQEKNINTMSDQDLEKIARGE